MRWKIYTRLISTEGGIGVRWFWCGIDERGTRESRGFLLRRDCEADAERYGYRREKCDWPAFQMFPPMNGG